MHYDQAGLILVTRNYEACCAFYRETLGLPQMFQLDRPGSVLTGFDLGGTYLMVEPGRAEGQAGSPVTLRFNVEDVERAAEVLTARGVAVNIARNPWGITAEFFDPDGNRCALRSTAGFGE